MELSELSRACVHCGICLPACPTYSVLKEEADSPRGRVLLLEAFAEGRVDAASVRPHIDRCIGCRACETACPSGVRYGELLEQGRKRLGAGRWTRFFLNRILPRRWMVRALIASGRVVGRLPPQPKRTARWPTPPAEPRSRLTMHLGCLTPHVFPHLAADAAQVFTRLGYAVEPARSPSCCGALHRHAGLPEPGGDTSGMLSVAAGCSATPGMRDACALLLEEYDTLRQLSWKLRRPVKVAYDAPCHLLHAQGVDAAPLLDVIDGVERVPLAGSEHCCGAGGLYMEQQPTLARRVRDQKLDAIMESGARIVATANPGCMIWLWRGVRQRKLSADIEIVHPLSLLARASAQTPQTPQTP